MQTDFTPDSGPQSTCAPANHSECELRLDRPAPAGTHRTSSMRLLRLPQVIHRTGLKKTTLYELQKDGAFPMRIQITPHSVGWVEEEVNAWIAGRVAASKRLRQK